MAYYQTRRIAAVDIQTALGVPVHLGGALTLSGAYATTLTVTGITTLTLPTSGTVTALGNAVSGSGLIVLATSPSLTTPTISGATLSGTTTISNAPVLTALSGYVCANGSSAATASATIPTTALNIAYNETPTGSLNGSNTTFTLAHTPLGNSLLFCLNGQILRPGGSYDYTLSGATVTMLFAPASVDYVSAHYFY